MKKLTLLVAIGCLLSSCDKTTEGGSPSLTYFKDSKTNLCFAKYWNFNSYGSVTSIACVPCDSLSKVTVNQ